MKQQSPLLYFCATALLACDGKSTCFNERMHSPASRITAKFRASMKPDSVEKLTMSYFLVRSLVKELAEKEEGRLAKLEGEARELALQELAVQELREEWGVEVEVEDDEVVEVEVSHYSLFR